MATQLLVLQIFLSNTQRSNDFTTAKNCIDSYKIHSIDDDWNQTKEELTVSEKGDQNLQESGLCISILLASCRDAMIHWDFSTVDLVDASICLM